jgi:hypothetical protein
MHLPQMRNTVQRCLEFRSDVTGGMSGLLFLLAFPLGGAAAYFLWRGARSGQTLVTNTVQR